MDERTARTTVIVECDMLHKKCVRKPMDCLFDAQVCLQAYSLWLVHSPVLELDFLLVGTECTKSLRHVTELFF